MKTIILAITVLFSGSLIAQNTLTKLDYSKIEVSSMIDDLQDLSEWTMQDIESGNIDEKVGLGYIEMYQKNITRLMAVYNHLKEIEETNK